jgi:DNA polymerase (family X)
MATTKNGEAVDLLQLIGDLMELRGDASFRVRAYREAARQLDLSVEDVEALAREDRLTEIKGVGPSIARTIKDYLETGASAQLTQLRQEVPETLVELLGIRHFGPARIVKVHRALGVTSLDELEAAAGDGRLAGVPGFGQKTVETLQAAIKHFRAFRGHLPRYVAEAIAGNALHGLRQMAGSGQEVGVTGQVTIVGDMRRLCESVERIDLLAASDAPQDLLDAFARLSLFREVTERSQWAAVALTRERFPVRLRVVPPHLWGPALQRFTGGAAHNAKLLSRARTLGLGILGTPPDLEAPDTPTAAGAWPGLLLEADGTALEAADEAALYARLGLPLIPPELREDQGEIEAAQAGRLPRLLTLSDIRVDLHLHSTWSDGHDDIATMARRAQQLGREYIAISDHSQSLGVARGLTIERLAEQRQEIAAVDAELNGIRLLSSVELDILADGSLDYPDEVLAQFDFVTASIHSGFQQAGDRLTRRVTTAMRSRHVDAIGHLTGRILGRRGPLELDVEAILKVATETGTAMEINAWPNRLDLSETSARRAKQLGVKLVINTDSHAADQLEYMRYGVAVARRAWIEPADVLNALPLDDLLATLRARQGKG